MRFHFIVFSRCIWGIRVFFFDIHSTLEAHTSKIQAQILTHHSIGQNNTLFGLVVDGATFHILVQRPDIKHRFCKLMKICTSVVACRVRWVAHLPQHPPVILLHIILLTELRPNDAFARRSWMQHIHRLMTLWFPLVLLRKLRLFNSFGAQKAQR